MASPKPDPKKVLVVDVGGAHVKILATGHREPRKAATGSEIAPADIIAAVKELAGDWAYDAVSIGYPGVVRDGRPTLEPHNLAPGWVGLDFEAAFGCPVKVVNDAAMQALGSYVSGKMLFLGLGTGLGSAMIVDGIIEPMELGHLPYRKHTYEDYVGEHGLEKRGLHKWRYHVGKVIDLLVAALEPDETAIGGGNAEKLDELPPNCRVVTNDNAFIGGFRLWEPSPRRTKTPGAS
jgi:polyphosphate glucokinase